MPRSFAMIGAETMFTSATCGRIRPANVALIQGAIKDGRITGFMSATANRVEQGKIFLNTPDGVAELKCDRVIARIGALPPRKFVESCGIVFPSANPTAVPQVSDTYESNVPGLYLAGTVQAGRETHRIFIENSRDHGERIVRHLAGRRQRPPAPVGGRAR